MIPYKQLSLVDIFQDCQDKFNNDKPVFLSLLENYINIDDLIPLSFTNHFDNYYRLCLYFIGKWS